MVTKEETEAQVNEVPAVSGGAREAELFAKLDQSARQGAFPSAADGSNPLLDRIREGR